MSIRHEFFHDRFIRFNNFTGKEEQLFQLPNHSYKSLDVFYMEDLIPFFTEGYNTIFVCVSVDKIPLLGIASSYMRSWFDSKELDLIHEEYKI